jgi:hypothetical protein
MRTTGLRPDAATGPRFAYRSALAGEVGRDAELRRAQATQDRREADKAHEATTDLTGVATLWAAGLVFFTLAQVARERSRARRTLALSGVGVVVVAIVLPAFVVTW